jgi:hypothetical protein
MGTRNITSADRVFNEQSANGGKSVGISFVGGPVVVASDSGAAGNLWAVVARAKELCDDDGVTATVTFDENNMIQSIALSRTRQ